MKNKFKLISLFALAFIVVLIGMSIALQAQPGGSTELRAQTCSAEDIAANHTFGGACDGTYPAACPTDLLSCNDGSVETHTNDGDYAGVKITTFNSTITNCGSINQVFLCHEFWLDAPGSAAASECTIEVSANGGAANITVNNTCPGTTANPGMNCQNITSSAAWSCGNFLGSSGTRAVAQMQYLESSAGTARTLSADVLFFNVTYAADTFAPNINFTSPTSSSGIFASRNYIEVNVTASDTNLANVTIRLFNSTRDQIRINISGSSPFYINYSGLSDGLYFYNSSANDTFGNTNHTETRNITLDTIKPTINFTNPTEVSGSILTRNNTLINVTANDTNLANITIRLFNSTGLVNQTTTTTSPNFVNITNLPNGIYFFNATAVDLANNQNSTETRNVTIDTINPGINFTNPSETSGSILTRNNTLINVTTNDTNLANITIRLFNSTGLANQTTTTTSPNFVNITNLPDGIYFFNASAYDLAGNVNYTETRNVTIDMINPLIDYGSGTANDGANVSVNFVFVNVTVTEANEANITFRLFNSTGSVNITTFTTAIRTINFTSLPQGTYTYNVTVVDIANRANTTATRTITLDVTAPNATILAPQNGTFNSTTQQNFTLNVSDNLGLKNATLNIYNSTGLFNSTTVTFVGGTVQSVIGIIVTLVDGVYNWFWNVYDLAGNLFTTQSVGGNRTITIDSSVPLVTSLSPSAGSQFRVNDTVNITALVADNNTSAVLANITLPNGTINVFRMSNAIGNLYNITFTNLAQKGTYIVRIIANDSVGNTNSTETTNFTRITEAGKAFDIVSNNSQLINFTQTIINNVSGVLDVQLNFTNHTILNIIVYGHSESSPYNVLRIANSTSDSSKFDKTFAIDLSELNMSGANVTITAFGNTLYKCTNYTFSSSTCNDGYEFLRSLTPGQNYTFFLNATDPGFGDQSPDAGTPDNGTFEAFGDGFSSTVNTFTAMQADDSTYFAVRQANGGGAQLDLGAWLNITYNITNITNQGVTPQKITNLSFFTNYCFNDDVLTAFTCGGGVAGGAVNNPQKIQILNYTSGQFQTFGTYNASNTSSSEFNKTAEMLSGFNDLINNSIIIVRYEANVSITVNGNDAAMGVDLATLTVTFDNTPPNVTNLIPVNGSNFNTSQIIEISANVTDNIAVSFVRANITLPNGTINQLTLNNAVGSIYNNSFTIPLLIGRYNVTIIANDSVNNINSSERTFFIANDTLAPNATLLSPANNTFTNNATQNYTVNITDNISIKNATLNIINSTGSIINQTTTTFIGGVVQGVLGVVVNLVDGIYNWFYNIFDFAGNQFITNNNTITIDTINPAINFTTLSETSGSIIRRNNTLINVTSTDVNLANITIRLFNSTGLVNQTTTTSSPNFVNITNLRDGIYFFNASAFDLAGNVNHTETRNVTIDTIKPAINFTSPSETSGSVLSRNNTLINVTASDPNLANITIRLFNSTHNLINSSNSSTSPFFVNISNLANGIYLFNATAFDLAGNINNTETRNFTIDTTAVVITFVDPTPANNSVQGTSVIINATVVNGASSIETCLLEFDGVNQTMTKVGSGSSVSCNATKTSLSEGRHNYTLFANTTSGVSASKSRIFTVDTTNPQVTIVSPANGTIFTVDNYAIDIRLNESGYCEYSVNSGVTNNTLTANSSNTGFTGTRSGVSNGNYVLNAYCNDTAGNRNNTQNASFSVNVAAAAAPAVPAASGGGGGGGAVTPTGVWINTFTPANIEFVTGYTRELNQRERIRINVNGLPHYVGIINISTNTMLIEVTSTPQNDTLRIGETRRYDVTNDSYYDIKVTLNGIKNGKANLTVTSIREAIAAMPAVPAAPEVTPEAEEIVPEEARKITNIIYPIILVLISLAILALLLYPAQTLMRKIKERAMVVYEHKPRRILVFKPVSKFAHELREKEKRIVSKISESTDRAVLPISKAINQFIEREEEREILNKYARQEKDLIRKEEHPFRVGAYRARYSIGRFGREVISPIEKFADDMREKKIGFVNKMKGLYADAKFYAKEQILEGISPKKLIRKSVFSDSEKYVGYVKEVIVKNGMVHRIKILTEDEQGIKEERIISTEDVIGIYGPIIAIKRGALGAKEL